MTKFIKKQLVEATVADAVDAAITPKEQEQAIASAEKVLGNSNSNTVEISPEGSTSYNPNGDIEQALDDAFRQCEESEMNDEKGNYPNLILIGIGGTGKTARVKAWCDRHNITCVTVMTSSMDSTDLAGIPVPDIEHGRVKKLVSGQLAPLFDAKKPCILFLDEYNRGSKRVRDTFLKVIEEHIIEDTSSPTGTRDLDNLLFTVAAINPADDNYNVDNPDDAEKGRFNKIWVANSKAVSKGYINDLFNKRIKKEKEKIEMDSNPKYKEWLIRDMGRLDIANTLFDSSDFQFDSAEDIRELHNNEEPGDFNQILSSRSFTKLLLQCDGTKEDFLRKWSGFCNPYKKSVAEDILANYVDVKDKANDALLGGTDSQVIFKSRKDIQKERTKERMAEINQTKLEDIKKD